MKKDSVMMRVDRDLLGKLRSMAGRHPLKPTLRATVERAIELMIEDLEEELSNVSK
jgi:hypothetical protein